MVRKKRSDPDEGHNDNTSPQPDPDTGRGDPDTGRDIEMAPKTRTRRGVGNPGRVDPGSDLSIRPLSAELYDWALKLTNDEGWDYQLGDLERLCALEPLGNLVAFDHQEEPVGYLTALAFAPLGLIGNVATAPRARKKGVATRLMESALTYLERAGCTTQRLFAYTHTSGFYHRLGFEAAGVSITLQGMVPEMEPLAGPEPYDKTMLDELLAFDLGQVAYDRGRLLRTLLEVPVSHGLVSRDSHGVLDGYLIVSGSPLSNSEVTYGVGPWVVSPGCVHWQALLENAMVGLEQGAKLELNTVADNQRVLNLCASLGIGPCSTTLDMLRGRMWSPPEQNVLARAGLVKG